MFTKDLNFIKDNSIEDYTDRNRSAFFIGYTSDRKILQLVIQTVVSFCH